MATKKTKKLSELTTASSVDSAAKFPMTDANGKVTLATLATLKAAVLNNMDTSSMYDNVMIMYHRKSDNYPLMTKLSKWTSLQTSGEIADGVAVVEGGHVLIVAPTESTSALTWSSADITGGATTTSDRVTAIADWNGKSNTAAIIKASTTDAITNTAQYAPGYCNLYSRANANGQGLTAGKWWLPSIGELMMIYGNFSKINYALSLITGATQLQQSRYWTSTEYSSKIAWYLYLTDGYLSNGGTKASYAGHVRAVSAFIS